MKIVVALMVCLGALAPAFAEGPLTATLDARKVLVAADGKESFVAADSARPADVIEYRTTYRNTSKNGLHAVAATLPVPTGFTYIAGTASKDARASLDGKTYAPVPLTRVVKQPDGSSKVENVPVSEYRFLRWELGDMPASASQIVVARMRMNDANNVAAR